MNSKEAAIGNWAKIFEEFNLPPITGKKHFKGECPLCKRKGKFRIDDYNGTGSFICSCNSGDGWKLLELTQKESFASLAAKVDKIVGRVFTPTKQQRPMRPTGTAAARARVISKYPKLDELKGTTGAEYLNSRGITSLPTENIKFLDKQRCNGGVLQALWSLATDDKGTLCYLHRTLLDGAKKAGGESSKKLMKLQEDNYLDHTVSVAIRMFPPASTLGIAEGIETALSARQVYKCATWATLNTGFMKKFKVPAGVKHLIIFADADRNAAGHAAAFECAHKNYLSKDNDLELISIRWPESGDFNDYLLNGGKIFEWRLHK